MYSVLVDLDTAAAVPVGESTWRKRSDWSHWTHPQNGATDNIGSPRTLSVENGNQI